MITKEVTARKIAAYLHHEIGLADLVDWAETAMMDSEFDPDSIHELAEVVSRLGVADVQDYGLTWEECETLLGKLGYEARVEVVAK